VYLVCVVPYSLGEFVNQVNQMINDEGEAFEGMLSVENVGLHLWDNYLECGS
jgi:hypothetical protein